MYTTWGPSAVSMFSSFSKSFLKEGTAGHGEGEEEEEEQSTPAGQRHPWDWTKSFTRGSAVYGKVARQAIWMNQ